MPEAERMTVDQPKALLLKALLTCQLHKVRVLLKVYLVIHFLSVVHPQMYSLAPLDVVK